jgi:hypothetical protein
LDEECVILNQRSKASWVTTISSRIKYKFDFLSKKKHKFDLNLREMLTSASGALVNELNIVVSSIESCVVIALKA